MEVAMRQESLCRTFTLTLTPRDRVSLEKLSIEHGATMRGYLRKLLRDAAASELKRGHDYEGAAYFSTYTR